MFALSFYPVGWEAHNEFIALVRSTTFRRYQKCLKIDKLTTCKEINLFLKMNFYNHRLFEIMKSMQVKMGSSTGTWRLLRKKEKSKQIHMYVHTQMHTTQGPYHQVYD